MEASEMLMAYIVNGALFRIAYGIYIDPRRGPDQ